jgi:hypothetical protein
MAPRTPPQKQLSRRQHNLRVAPQSLQRPPPADPLSGNLVRKRRLLFGTQNVTLPHPARFWIGLPKGPVKAFCLGDPYITLWPEAAQRGVLLANNTILVAPTRLDPTLPEPPEALADPCDAQRPGTQRRGQYAKTFPFQIPDLPNA